MKINEGDVFEMGGELLRATMAVVLTPQGQPAPLHVYRVETDNTITRSQKVKGSDVMVEETTTDLTLDDFTLVENQP